MGVAASGFNAKDIHGTFIESARLFALAAEDTSLHEAACEAAEMIIACLKNGGKLLLCGNGGSAADSEHIAGELLKGFLHRRPLPTADAAALRSAGGADGDYLAAKLQRGLRAVALTGHPALATAVANDNGGDLVFAQQLWALARRGDVLLAITTSGNSRNVLLAAAAARALGVKVVGLTGRGGGKLAALADFMLCVPENETFKIQELHLPLYHALCAMLEARTFGAAEGGL